LTLLRAFGTVGDTRNAKTARGITTGARYEHYSKAEIDLIGSATDAYEEYASHIYISEGIGDIGAKQIREAVNKHFSITGQKPVVVIDYLQILAPYNERYTDKQNTDKAVLELKRISRDFKIPVIGISSFNRANYKAPVSMEAFKESGAIEYSSDVLLGLQLHGTKSNGFDVNAAKDKNPRDIQLYILKNRNGATGKQIAFQYYPMFNYFEETGDAGPIVSSNEDRE
jgi:replicative DNA helicase